jgi:hypothetical protein
VGLTMKFKAAVVALVVVLLLLSGVSHALTDKQKVLVGLKGVHVFVEKIHPEVEGLGLTTEQIKTDVEMRLRKGGVKVLTMEEMLQGPEIPLFVVNLNISILPDWPLCVFSIELGLINGAGYACHRC